MCTIEAAIILQFFIDDTILQHAIIGYRISSFKHRGVYLILRFLGAAFIRGRHLFQKSKQKKMKSCVNSKQYDVF